MPRTTAGNDGPVALVTGGGRGVGAEIARALAGRGYRVAIHCHASLPEARRLATEIEAAGGQALAVTANLREEGAVRALMHRVADHFGRIDVVVATARMLRPGSLEETAAADLLAHFEVGVVGTFVVAQEAAAVMVRQEAGGLVVALAAAAEPRPDELAFWTAQAAIPGLMQALAVEFAARHPRLRACCLPVPFAAAEPQAVVAAVLATIDAGGGLTPPPAAGS